MEFELEDDITVDTISGGSYNVTLKTTNEVGVIVTDGHTLTFFPWMNIERIYKRVGDAGD
jgi:endonuclease V-like protein UPF0215 family